MRCCEHRDETEARSAVHKNVCPNGGHHKEEKNWIGNNPEAEVLVTTSESGDDLNENPNLDQDWEMEDGEANNDSFSVYEYSDYEVRPQESGKASPP